MSPDLSELRHRLDENSSGPAVVYLPGLHGDWTLIGGLRERLDRRVRFIEFAYPRNAAWTLADYAAAVSAQLHLLGIHRFHLLGESFGSQVAWAIVAGSQNPAQVQSVILAGGFLRHPFSWGATGAAGTTARFPSVLLQCFMHLWTPLARIAYEKRPGLADDFRSFARARAAAGDREAIASRLRMIATNDASEIAGGTRAPVRYLTGFWDPVVPWPVVRRQLRVKCPGYRETHVIACADHAVLVARPTSAAAKILEWITRG